MYNVRKKDGSTEPFDRGKVAAGVVKAGGTVEEAEKVAAEVETWVAGVAVENMVEGMQIRDKVLEVLKGINAAVAASFEAFKKGPEAGGVV